MEPTQEELEKNIWRCNCADEREHTDPDYHQSICWYAQWYRKITGEQEEDNE